MQGEGPGNQLFVGTIALPFVSCCATIASLPVTPFLWRKFPRAKFRWNFSQTRAKKSGEVLAKNSQIEFSGKVAANNSRKILHILHEGRNHRVLEGAPPRGRQLHFTFPSAPDPLFKASKAPLLTLTVVTPSGAPCQAPLDETNFFHSEILGVGGPNLLLPWRQYPSKNC